LKRKWIKQKKRHLITGSHYKRRDKYLLGGEILSRMLFYVSFVYLMATQTLLPAIAGAFLLRWISLLVIYKYAMIKLDEKQLLLSSLIFDIVSPLLNVGLFITNLSTERRPSWK